MREIRNCALIGRGAVGILYGMMLKEGGAEPVFLVDEERKRRYESTPLVVNGEEVRFRYVSEPAKPLDLILITTKANGLGKALETIRPLMKADTVILSCLNGISSEDMVRQAFPDNPVVRTIVQGMDSRFLDGICTYSHKGLILYGPEREGEDRVCDRLDAFFAKTDIPHRRCEDIVREQWNKLMLNCGINQVCCVYGTGYGGALSEKLLPVFVGAMDEVRNVAQKKGIPLDASDIGAWVDTVRSLDPDSMPSMAQDRLAGRQTEVALFSGTVCPMARELGLETPILDGLWRCILDLEAGMKKPGA